MEMFSEKGSQHKHGGGGEIEEEEEKEKGQTRKLTNKIPK